MSDFIEDVRSTRRGVVMTGSSLMAAQIASLGAECEKWCSKAEELSISVAELEDKIAAQQQEIERLHKLMEVLATALYAIAATSPEESAVKDNAINTYRAEQSNATT